MPRLAIAGHDDCRQARPADRRNQLRPLGSAVDENIFAVAHAHIQRNLIPQRRVYRMARRESQASRYVEARIFVDGDCHRRQKLRWIHVFGHESRGHHGLEAGVCRQVAELLELNGRENAWNIPEQRLQVCLEIGIGELARERSRRFPWAHSGPRPAALRGLHFSRHGRGARLYFDNRRPIEHGLR